MQQIITHRKGLSILKDNWHEIINKLRSTYTNVDLYPFDKRIIYYVSGTDKRVPSVRSLNKIFKFMQYEYHIPERKVNTNMTILAPKLDNIKIIIENYDRIPWGSFYLNKNNSNFFRDTKKTGDISTKYYAPPIKVTNKIIKRYC